MLSLEEWRGRMLQSRTILVVDGSAYGGIDLSFAIAECDGMVVGPVASAADALGILDEGEVAGAVVDCEVADAVALVTRLAQSNVPMIIRTCGPLPQPLDGLAGQIGVLVKPVDTRIVIDALLDEIGKVDLRQEQD